MIDILLALMSRWPEKYGSRSRRPMMACDSLPWPFEDFVLSSVVTVVRGGYAKHLVPKNNYRLPL